MTNFYARIAALSLASVLIVGCGNGNNENNTNNANNANNANNTANNTVNNTANNTVNNTANNTANNTNNTNNMTTTYTPHDFTCPNEVTPAGELADLVGTWELDDGCYGTNRFALVEQLCPEAVLTTYSIVNFDGKFVVTDTNRGLGSFTGQWSSELYVPDRCVVALGGGTCDGAADFMESAAEGVTATCADEPTPGDCLCQLNGDWSWRMDSELADNGAGTFTESFFRLQSDDSYVIDTLDWEFQTDGTTLQMREPGETTSFTLTKAADDATACEAYCFGFMWTCNDNPNVTDVYDDDADCLAQCAGFAAGTPGDMAGDTLDCRVYHLGAAADTSDLTNPDTHCPHAQATATSPCN